MKSVHVRLNGFCFSDNGFVVDCFFKAIEECNFHVRDVARHDFYPNGITLLVVLAESNAGISTYPNLNFAEVDFVSCQDDSDKSIDSFILALCKWFKVIGVATVLNRHTMRVESSKTFNSLNSKP